MKHYLNFKPSIVFRKGSSFMLKTSLLILYGLPLALLFFWSYSYFSLNSVNSFYDESYKELKKKSDEFTSELDKIKPDKAELADKQQAYFDYRKVSAAIAMSWSPLFEALEEITPGDVMFYRIRIKPDKLVKVIIEGEAERLIALTGFVKKLYKENNFLNPMLQRHSRPDEDSEVVTFSLVVDYLGQRGEMP
jgi:hypothetical protein